MTACERDSPRPYVTIVSWRPGEPHNFLTKHLVVTVDHPKEHPRRVMSQRCPTRTQFDGQQYTMISARGFTH
jgi:hypothetical protein